MYSKLKVNNFYFIVQQKKAKSTYNLAYRTRLSEELKMRISHNQWYINSIKATIEKFLETKYTEEHLSILAKLVKHCTRKSEAEILSQSKLTCPQNILAVDVRKRITNFNYDPEIMSEEDNAMYRELVDDADVSKKDRYHDFSL